MDWLYRLFFEHSALEALVVIALICAIGLALAKIHIRGISLGVTWVFFVGILAGHFGLSVDSQMLVYAEDFGLVIFVYALGLQVGPGFFSAFRQGGVRLNVLAMTVVLMGTLMAVGGSFALNISLPDMMGILSGAVTNTPSLAAAQQALVQLGRDTGSPALGCAVTYPLGVVGVIIAIVLLQRLGRSRSQQPAPEKHAAYIAAFLVKNPGIFGKNIRQLGALNMSTFVISRLWREEKVMIPTSETVVREGDRLLVITSEADVPQLTAFFGELEHTDWNKRGIDWNSIDSTLVSQRIIITRPSLNGKKLGDLHLRNLYGINVSRIFRSGVELLPEADLVLQYGDRLTVVGKVTAVRKVADVFGNAVKDLEEPNLVAVFIGIVFGLALGAVPFNFPGMNMPVKLGLAGGPIVVGLLIGTFGPRLHMITYTTRSANLMLRSLGLSTYLACLGLDAGAQFFETVLRPEGLLWIGTGFALTLLPVLLVGCLALKWLKMDFGVVTGMLCGSMANPMALTYANDLVKGDTPSVSYATVYPLCMFCRVIIAQVILLFMLT